MTDRPQLLALFPGQGSQKVGMGLALRDSSELARDVFARADAILNLPLSKICFEGPAAELTLTHIAQPAILTVSTICYQLYLQQGGPSPAIAAGHSLGEYSALVAAESITFEDAVLLVHKRGRYMQEAVSAGQGSMLAILGKEVSEIEEAISKIKEGLVQIANINAPGQIVVAGDTTGLSNLKDVMTGSKIMELSVSAPFHCDLMSKAAENLKKDLAATTFKTCKFPVIANYSAQPHGGPDEIRRKLEEQVCGRVRWVESMQYALSAHSALETVEFGAGNVLSGLMKRISPQTPRTTLDSLSSIDEFLKLPKAS